MTTTAVEPAATAATSETLESVMQEQYGAVLQAAGMFHGLSSDVTQALTQHVRGLRVARGERLFDQGDPGDRLFIVLSGKVKLVQTLARGKERLVAVLGPGDQFGEMSLLDPGPRTSAAVALTDADLAWLDRSALQRWLSEYPEVAHQMLRVVSRRLRRTRADVADAIFVDVPGRVAKNLILLGQRFGARAQDGWRVPHDLTQSELAQLVGASRESVNRALSDFANRRWIKLEHGSVVIIDLARLRARAGLMRR